MATAETPPGTIQPIPGQRRNSLRPMHNNFDRISTALVEVDSDGEPRYLDDFENFRGKWQEKVQYESEE